MICNVCGKVLSDSASFCNHCGNAVVPAASLEETAASGVYECDRCGAELQFRNEVCSQCGGTAVFVSDTDGEETTGKKRKTFVITVFLCGIAMMIGFITYLTVVYFVPMFTQSKNAENTSAPTQAATTPTAAPTPPAASTEPNEVLREQGAYDSKLYYNRMENIHKSEPVEHETFLILETQIKTFDSQCADYMNGDETAEPPAFLRPGSEAYRSQTEYKKEHPSLQQYYDAIYVQEARYDGEYYYVWVEETICTYEFEEKSEATHHWVYKLENENGKWYVDDFTKDPRYK